MSFLYEFGWSLFILSEGLTWGIVLLFIVSRYFFHLDRLSQWFLFLIILFTVFQAFLAGVNYYITGKVSFFQVVIILFIIYAGTLGSSNFERLDIYIQQWINNYLKSDKSDRIPVIPAIDFKQENLIFGIHSIAFFGILLFWYAIDSHPLFAISIWLQHPHLGLFNNSIFNVISYVWCITYIFELFFYILNALIWWMRQNRHI
ncbi:hypothetical protein [Salibacterium aidingense]|uniref:hypothetical protein n=1 Tax=Salibacterium aidingense TaxID=384933 RepID=UPI00047EA231|nr:hypothetical protein [Salibacterium aidingense]